MSLGELLLTALVALFIFGPERLPSLARNLGKVFQKCNSYKLQLLEFWQEQKNIGQLDENIKKAQEADKYYSNDETEPRP